MRQNDNAAFGVIQSRVAFVATAGTTYQIALDTASAHYFDIPGTTGGVTLNWSQPARPVNDQFAMAARLDPDGAGYRLLLDVDDNRGATVEPRTGPRRRRGRPPDLVPLDRPDVRPLREVHTRGSSFDTLLGVYTGSTLSGLTLAAADDDGGGG